MPVFSIHPLQFLPRQETNPNVWGDHLELLCSLTIVGEETTVQRVTERFIEEHKGDVQAALKSLSEPDSQILGPEPEDALGEDAPPAEDVPDLGDEDRIRGRIQEHFDFLVSRNAVYGDAYPFELNDQRSTLRRLELTPIRRAYIVLLVSSLLRHITNGAEGRHFLTGNFELLCEHPFRQMVPAQSEVRYFGVSAQGYAGPAITGALFAKVQVLSQALAVGLGEDCTSQKLQGNNGDGGLDWVAWCPLGDTAKTLPLFVAQCACGVGWEGKQNDAAPERWRSYLQIKNDYLIYHFIPRSFREHSGNWENALDIFNVVLVDRLRLLNLLRGNGEDFLNTSLQSYVPLFDELPRAQVVDAFT